MTATRKTKATTEYRLVVPRPNGRRPKTYHKKDAAAAHTAAAMYAGAYVESRQVTQWARDEPD